MTPRLMLMQMTIQPSEALITAVYKAVLELYPDAVLENAPEWDTHNQLYIWDRPAPEEESNDSNP